MTTFTADQLRHNRDVFLRVHAVAKPGHEEFMEFRFPGLTNTGYLIETGGNVLAYLDWLTITGIEKW